MEEATPDLESHRSPPGTYREKKLSQESNPPAPYPTLCYLETSTSPSLLSITTILLEEGRSKTLIPGVRFWLLSNQTAQVKRKHETEMGLTFCLQ